MNNVKICNRVGTLHFIRFPTSEMNNFLDLAKKKGMATSVSTVCATGGGAFKFEENFKNVSTNSNWYGVENLNLNVNMTCECDIIVNIIYKCMLL